ncbi:MAG: hypothetical protein N4A35_02790 [Flavobacteriales bacterium]|jgi:hypothetical protein|nr:hypothetical protein [Flavobacteriales bacterium]
MLKSLKYFVIFFLATAFFYYRWGVETQLVDWKETPASILAVSPVQQKIDYIYYVDGVVLRNNVLSIDDSDVETFVDRCIKHSLIKGNKVICYYNPKQIKEAVIVNESKAITAWTWIGLVVFIVLSLIQVYYIIDKALDLSKKNKK